MRGGGIDVSQRVIMMQESLTQNVRESFAYGVGHKHRSLNDLSPGTNTVFQPQA